MTEKHKVCTKCCEEKSISEFRKKKNKFCKIGYYISGTCIICENKTAREADTRRRKIDKDYVRRRRDAVKKYMSKQSSKDKRKAYVEKTREKIKERSRRYREKNYAARLKRMQRDTDKITDEYIITQLQNPHRRVSFSRAYIKEHPELIEITRVKILAHRLRKKIERLSYKGLCRRCKKIVPISEFRKQQKTNKRTQHIIRLCRKCQLEVSKENWNKYGKQHTKTS